VTARVRDGIAAPVSDQVRALRTSVGLNRRDHVAVIRVEGPDAFALLDATSPAPLFLRESQMRHTLLLDDDARPAADLFICSDEDGFFLLADGVSAVELAARLQARRAARLPAADVAVRSLADSHQLIGLDGPYAWELATALLGPTVLGMPYLTLLRIEDVVCFRAGKTGEFGYDLLLPRESVLPARLAELGAGFDLTPVGLEALDVCALENWHFSVRIVRDTPLARPLTPLELQLQWRVDYGREFVGAEALRARRAAGPAVRATSFLAPASAPVAAGDAIRIDGKVHGEVLAAAPSPTLGGAIGVALLETRLAHPGIELEIAAAAGSVAAATRTPPLVRNRSLFVDPHRHSYRTRDAESFPPLVMS
jgi:glycine cleavage system aminomethyltransferase T